MPTWQILPAADGHLRWVAAAVAGGDPRLPPEATPPETQVYGDGSHPIPNPRLPSMADLLLQARPKLLEAGAEQSVAGDPPMFRTGSGRSVSLSESSIRKARAVLEGEGSEMREGEGLGDGNGRFPMFRTGLGKSVTVKQSSIRKAASVLGGENEENDAGTIPEGGGDSGGFPMFQTGSGKPVTVKQDSFRKAVAILEGEDMNEEGSGGGGDFPLFQTGSGKPVTVKQDSLRKAVAILEGEDMKKGGGGGRGGGGFAMFQTGAGMPVTLKQNSFGKAVAILEGEDMKKDYEESLEEAGGGHISMFCNGQGKPLNVTRSSVRKATTVLEEQDVEKASFDSHQGYKNNGDASMFHTELGNSISLKHSSVKKASSVLQNKDNMEKGELHKYNIDGQLFQTSSGKAINISSAGLSRATALLGLERNDISNTQTFGHSRDQLGNLIFRGACKIPQGSEVPTFDSALPPIMFQTAGGKSVSVSSNALQRARSLLGDSDLEVFQNDINKSRRLTSAPKDEKLFDEISCNKENITSDSMKESSVSELLGYNPNKSNANGTKNWSSSSITPMLKPQHKGLYTTHNAVDTLKMTKKCRIPSGPLVEISNFMGVDNRQMDWFTTEKRSLGRRNSISPFKRPRTSRFMTPLNSSLSFFSTGSSELSTIHGGCRQTRLSNRYPFQLKRKKMKEFFGGPSLYESLIGHIPEEVKHVSADNSLKFEFHSALGCTGIGLEAFQQMLLQSGASLSSATKEWVANHYKWIVWKLACLERCYPAIAGGKYLTVSNVLEELKYRYDREVNHGHRSAIKKILEGDASPASMMVLCVSAIHSHSDQAAKIELTDGWYPLDAVLDVSLSKQLQVGKLFVGQKLRVWGATLCGWVGPISFLEASNTVSLLIHINGTFRAKWDEPLGFCKVPGPPLAFRCIKSYGGIVPMTLVGVTRVYPLLYTERFPNGGSVVRSERMERKALQLYHQRRSKIAEDIMSEQQEHFENINDSDEGAKICKILESAAEPEVIMAEMSSEQLISLSSYQAKKNAIKQSDINKKIEKAFEASGLSSRDVTPFMKVRVVGLTSKSSHRKGRTREGLITIWNPTEIQKIDMVEGEIYSVTGLTPLNCASDILHLRARGSSTLWRPLPSTDTRNFEPFFSPRKAILLSNLGEVPLASEFDIAAVIVHVGEVYLSENQKRQWIFMTDGSGSTSEIHFEEIYDCLLAVSFCSPNTDNDSSALFTNTLSGTTVGFCNLIKRARDQINHIWVAEATENSTCSISYNLPSSSHLKEAAISAEKWAKISYPTIHKMRERVLCVVGGHGS